jgi:hypothetical protein
LSSPFAANLFSERKLGLGLPFCIDNRDINNKTIKNWYPLPLIKEIFNLLGKAERYTKLNVQGAYIPLQVEKGDEQKLTIRTQYGLYEPTVIQMENKCTCGFRGIY